MSKMHGKIAPIAISETEEVVYKPKRLRRSLQVIEVEPSEESKISSASSPKSFSSRTSSDSASSSASSPTSFSLKASPKAGWFKSKEVLVEVAGGEFLEKAESAEASESIKPRKTSVSDVLDLQIAITKLKEMERIRAEYLPLMKKGIYVEKLCKQGTKKKRFIAMSHDERTILWGKSPGKYNKKLDVEELKQVKFGPKTERFAESFDPIKDNPNLCFSFLSKSRTFDFEALSERDAYVWFLGLQALIPLDENSEYVSRGKLHWIRIIQRTKQLADMEHKSIPDVWKSAWKNAVLQMFLLRKLED